MEYLDGGGVPRWLAAAGFDIALLAIPALAPLAGIKFLGKQAAQSLIKKFAPKIAGAVKTVATKVLGFSISFSANRIANLIVDGASNFTSIGGVAAYALDYLDGDLNGWIF
ncbi:hypothetical protein ABGF49_05620 [Helcococcus ovis]|uniref:Uncharacterized protein n=2 Tax=Helcococcus TaxID=31983 RepID=A0A4R9C2A6_9FIRM|nr:hypothetical protein [Helcococcus ovis]TFF65996.1 hypothetical protein EQF92_00825 [Helcococcus ovis]TFF67012.1 hypothetical protein EQF91_02485 [Helcococcus ovis]TFF68619.1 hypothetical protein EQF93_01855 [Helcococcus ovis]WNZ01348.1 hypothetical protein EQF90_000415 [Helcococcus ovis]